MEKWLPENLWNCADAVFLCTGMEENERFAQELAREQENIMPEQFDGLTPLVYHKLLYTAPFERFEGLRQLVLKVQEATGLRACYRGIVALDLKEWIGHEQEEYLKITFKFLHDHRKSWRMLFPFCAEEPAKINLMLLAAAPFVRPNFHQLYLFRDERLLKKYLETQAKIQPRACMMLSKVLCATPTLHNCALVGQILEELEADKREIDCSAVQSYLNNPCHLPSLLREKVPMSSIEFGPEKEKEC